MERDHYEVLSGVARILGDPNADPARSVKDILVYLADVLKVDEATLRLPDSHRKIFALEITSTGPDLFCPCTRKIAGTPEGTALKQRRPQHADGAIHLPVGSHMRPCGVLTLQPYPLSPPDAETDSFYLSLCDLLTSLVRTFLLAAEDRRHRQALALLAELGEELNRAGSLRAVLQAAVGVIRRHSQASCVILRPLHGETVLGSCQVWLDAAWRQWRPLFLELEEEQVSRALAGRTVLLRQGLGGGRSPVAALPSAMVSIPLFFQDCPMGVLTLFGEVRGEGLFLVSAGESKQLYVAIASQIGHAIQRVTALERLGEVSAENDRKLRETTLLFRIARAMHSTLRLDELMHMILSAATVQGGGGFERAMLFMLNERSGTLQGMLCVTRDTAALVLPEAAGGLAWERPVVSEEAKRGQREHRCCQEVMQQRLLLEEEGALARAASKGRVIFVPRPENEPSSTAALAERLHLAPYACAPLFGRYRPLGVLVVDNPQSREGINADRLRFLELFANLAGAAMENSMLLNRLEAAHQDLRETQERLIQGEKMAVLGEMAASVTHELRNPLVAIGGFAQRLVRVVGEGREKEYAAIIAREVQRMEEMLSNILAFAKKQLLCFAECHLARVIEEAIALELDALTLGEVQLVTEISDPLPLIQGDEQKLRQVLINLVNNARQAMPTGGVLTVRAHASTLRGNESVTVEVEDTGGGIPADILRNIFNPFFTTKERGTGLGLSISHRIVEQHRGAIEVKNRKKGAVFILRLPVCAVDTPFR